MPDDAEAPVGDWVIVARLGRTRGLRGEIYADGWNGPERYSELKRVWIRKTSGEWLNNGQPLEVVSLWPHKGRLVFQFAGIENIDAAEALERCEVVIPESERPPLSDGEYYLSDLIGCVVFDRRTGERRGVVTGWQAFGGPELLEVVIDGTRPEDAVWIPFARSICVEIDPAGRRIVIDPPEGLLGLNARKSGQD